MNTYFLNIYETIEGEMSH